VPDVLEVCVSVGLPDWLAVADGVDDGDGVPVPVGVIACERLPD
jgi:hypothetical protein